MALPLEQPLPPPLEPGPVLLVPGLCCLQTLQICADPIPVCRPLFLFMQIRCCDADPFLFMQIRPLFTQILSLFTQFLPCLCRVYPCLHRPYPCLQTLSLFTLTLTLLNQSLPCLPRPHSCLQKPWPFVESQLPGTGSRPDGLFLFGCLAPALQELGLRLSLGASLPEPG